MASASVPASRRTDLRSDSTKLSRKEAARKILALIECDMTKKEFTEVEKNQVAKQLARRIDQAIAARRKS
jgi:hypothetical protein